MLRQKNNYAIKVIALFFLTITSITAQQITLQDIWSSHFNTEGMVSLKPMNDSYYSVVEYDRKSKSASLVKYSYASQKKVATIVNSKIFNAYYFYNYQFSKDEQKLLVGTSYNPIYRHSFTSTYYLYDITTKQQHLIGDHIQEPTFSPNGQQIAYVKENNLFLFDINTKNTRQITQDGVKNKIINGIADWVYEEEFSFVKAFEWSKNGKSIAFLKFDETDVPEFSMDVYGKNLYPSQQTFKYPKAGEPNSKVTLHIYNVKKQKSTIKNLGKYEYIPRIKATQKADEFAVTTLNRHQNGLKLFLATTENEPRLLLNETSNTYLDINDNLTFLDDHSFIWTSDKSGWNHLYHYNANGKLVKQITKGNWEVTEFYGYQPKKKTLFYQSTEQGSINRAVYRISIKGKKKKLLTPNIGTNSAAFSSDKNYFINTFSSSQKAPIYTLYNAKGSHLKELKDNRELESKLAAYQLPKKEFSTISINGNNLNMWVITPADFNPSKKYPLLMYQYSGPGSQSVANSWNSRNDYWYYSLAQQGYIVACVDGRGTGYKGRDFKKVTYKELGKYEVEDQIAVANHFAKKSYIDANRIGIWGWSFGGFMSANCILKGNDTFSMAIAVAPVTNWRFYDSIYTERYMQTPQENESGYDNNSPTSHVDLLKGKLLLVHGTADDNVHVQNTMRMVEAFIQADKQFEWCIYPDKNHGIYGGNTRLHLYKKMTKFIKENL